MATKEAKTAISTTASASAMSAEEQMIQAVLGAQDLDDGLAEFDASDIKLAVKVFNMNSVDKAGDPIPKNVFYDTVDETTKKSIRAIAMQLHKTNEWSEFDDEAKRTVRRCRSFDRVVGVMEDGTERACLGCPDAQWREVDGKKRKRRCGEVWNVFFQDMEEQKPFVMRFKRTSLPVIQKHINQHHANKARDPKTGKPRNIPLWMFELRMSLKMDGQEIKYAIPVIERGPVLDRENLQLAYEGAKFVRDTLLVELRKVVESTVAENEADTPLAGPGDASFSPDDFSDRSDDEGLR